MMKDILNGLKNLLGYTRNEAIGFLVLSFILIIVALIPFLFGYFIEKNSLVSAKDARILDSLVNVMERNNLPTYFNFNPNQLPEDSMYLLGLNPSVVETWQNYRESGGVFYEKKDFKKIYGITDKDYDVLSDYIVLPKKKLWPEHPSTGSHKSAESHKVVRETFEPIDINKAQPEDLLFINGIGEKLSERIIKFRDLLGGYVSEDQFNEVYYLEGEALVNLKEHVFIANDFAPAKINLNDSSYKGILKHPYIDKQMTDQLFKIRHSEDSIITYEKLKKMMSGKDSLFLVLLPYVDF